MTSPTSHELHIDSILSEHMQILSEQYAQIQKIKGLHSLSIGHSLFSTKGRGDAPYKMINALNAAVRYLECGFDALLKNPDVNQGQFFKTWHINRQGAGVSIDPLYFNLISDSWDETDTILGIMAKMKYGEMLQARKLVLDCLKSNSVLVFYSNDKTKADSLLLSNIQFPTTVSNLSFPQEDIDKLVLNGNGSYNVIFKKEDAQAIFNKDSVIWVPGAFINAQIVLGKEFSFPIEGPTVDKSLNFTWQPF